MEQELFENEIREKCKKLLLKGDLQRVIAAKEFLGKSDYEFGLLLEPLFVEDKKENLVRNFADSLLESGEFYGE